MICCHFGFSRLLCSSIERGAAVVGDVGVVRTALQAPLKALWSSIRCKRSPLATTQHGNRKLELVERNKKGGTSKDEEKFGAKFSVKQEVSQSPPKILPSWTCEALTIFGGAHLLQRESQCGKGGWERRGARAACMIPRIRTDSRGRRLHLISAVSVFRSGTCAGEIGVGKILPPSNLILAEIRHGMRHAA